MSVEPNQGLPTYNDAPGVSSPHTAVPVNNKSVEHPGVGNLIFHIHSVHFKPILFAKEEVSLQFYEHIVSSIYCLCENYLDIHNSSILLFTIFFCEGNC